MAAKPLSSKARDLLDRVSRVVEANEGADGRTIRKRAGVARKEGEAALAYLAREGFVQRSEVNAQDIYRSLRPYRARDQGPDVSFGASHSTGQGGAG